MSNTKLEMVSIDCTTGEITIRDLTAEEIAQREVDQAAEEARIVAEAEVKAAKEAAKSAAQAKLTALGLTVEDLQALGL
jgi:hypothetical protein